MFVYLNRRNGEISELERRCSKRDRMRHWELLSDVVDGSGVAVHHVNPATGDAVSDPPRGNASRDAWAEFAGALGIDVDDTMTRNQIRLMVRRG